MLRSKPAIARLRSATAPRTLGLVMASAVLASTLSCGYRSGGQGWKGSSETFQSTEFLPATLTLTDTRTGEEVWTQDIPVGYQVVTRFISDGGTDLINRPDRLEYQVFERGTQRGRLRSAIAVPPAGARRWELSYREGPEFAEDGIRTGHLGNTPPWFELPRRPWPEYLNNPEADEETYMDRP